MMIRTAMILPMLLTLLGCALLPTAHAEDPLKALQTRIIDVGNRVRPSVVHIEAAIKQNNRRNLVTGSGVVMLAEGIVLTNEHVVERAEKVSVILPGKAGRYRAEVVGADKQTDLAVLRIERRSPEERFTAAEFGDSDALQVGEWVIAIGNPYGLDGTVSLGIVSAKGRDLRAVNLINDFIQTDAMIDRGSSGGPLVNLAGEVVGINSRGQGRGIGFTIPINTAKQVAADLLAQGQIARGYLGITIQPLDRELARYWAIEEIHGVIVNGVQTHSPAANAGLEVGDIVTGFDGHDVRAEKTEDVGSFQRMVARTKAGKSVDLNVLRDGSPRVLHATLGVQPKVVPDEEETDFGFTVQEVTEHLHRQYRLIERDGVLVSFVERGSEAAEAELTAGDLIQQIADQPVRDIESFRAAMKHRPRLKPFLIRARRGEEIHFLLINPRTLEQRAQSPGPTRATGS